MPLRDWFSKRSPLQLALERGLAAGSDLGSEIHKLGDFRIKSSTDAQAICTALERQLEPPILDEWRSPVYHLIALFQRVEDPDCDAFETFEQDGTSLLCRVVQAAIADPDRVHQDCALLALKMLALYQTAEGTDAVLAAARKPLFPEAYLWSVILSAYRPEHPEVDRLFGALREELPHGFLAIALLDAANGVRMNGGDDVQHPFDSRAGVERLESYLTANDPEHFSYAISATAALPFIEQPQRDALLALALEHADPKVRMEGAWAAAKLGREAGFKCLERFCLDINHAEQAKHYLRELGAEDRILEDAQGPDFEALAQFSNWLAHPNELGRSPDELKIIDRRDLAWPPTCERKPFWLIQYLARRDPPDTPLYDDDIGVGLVGSKTFCFFGYQLDQRPPEDAYAIHCYWEMQQSKLISEMEVSESSSEYDSLFEQWTGPLVEDAAIACIAELSRELRYPQPLVGAGGGTMAGEAGWLVLDGPRSHWYARATMPEDTSTSTVLRIHVGRVLLGFELDTSRASYLKPSKPQPPAQDIIAAYEKAIKTAVVDAPKMPLEARHLGGVLNSRFDMYLTALQEHHGGTKAIHVANAYEKLLDAADRIEPVGVCHVMNWSAALGSHFDDYVDSLVELGRQNEIPALIALFEPQSDHNLGYGRLGCAAYKAGVPELALRFLEKLRTNFRDAHRSEEMTYLADLWHHQGRVDEAREFLLDCLRRVWNESQKQKDSEKDYFEKIFQNHRAMYLKLFGVEAEKMLANAGIPSTTLRE